jgi:hypothetical protein
VAKTKIKLRRKAKQKRKVGEKAKVSSKVRQHQSVKRKPRGKTKPKLKLPYIQLVQRHGRIKIWTVDGSWVRKNLDEEFTNFGHHYSCPEIPKDELWLDREGDPDEHRFFIHHMVVERDLRGSGARFASSGSR